MLALFKAEGVDPSPKAYCIPQTLNNVSIADGELKKSNSYMVSVKAMQETKTKYTQTQTSAI